MGCGLPCSKSRPLTSPSNMSNNVYPGVRKSYFKPSFSAHSSRRTSRRKAPAFFDDEAAAGKHGVERIAEAFDAEVGALIGEEGTRFVVGFPPGEAPDDELGAIASGAAETLRVADLGECPAVAVELEGRHPLKPFR